MTWNELAIYIDQMSSEQRETDITELDVHFADIVINVSGGNVQDVFGPSGATVLMVDFDNIREDPNYELLASNVDGTPESEACCEVVEEAIKMIANQRINNK